MSKARAVLVRRAMYTITCGTSRTGRIITRLLSEAGRKIRVVVRKEDAAAALRARGIETLIADYADVAAMTNALSGSTAAYVIPPPLPVTASGHHAYRVARTETLAAAIRAAGVSSVVSLSSFAAQHPEGTGMIKSCHRCEQILDEQTGDATRITHLRPAFFLENWTAQIAAVRDGVLPSFLGPVDRRFTMVGTADIAAVATRLLLEPQPSLPPPASGVRRRVVQLSGHDDYSVADIAKTFAHLLGRPVEPMVLPIETMSKELVNRGFSDDTAMNYQELFGGMMTGHVSLDTNLPVERGSLGLAYTLGVMLSGPRAVAP